MADLREVKQAAEQLASAFEQYKSVNDQRLRMVEQRGSADGLIEEKVRKIDSQISRLQEVVSGVKTALRRPGLDLNLRTAEESEHLQAFRRYLTKGQDGELQALSVKSMLVGNDPEGGYIAPPELAERIVSRQYDTTPMRQLATVMVVSGEAVEMLRDTEEAEAAWISETATRTDTEQGALARIRIPVHELHAQPRATQKLLDDAVINVEEWLIAKVAGRFARRENAAFVAGTGINQPRGFADYPTAATGDASRAWGTLERVGTGQSAGFPASNPADPLMTLMHKLKAAYLPKAAWLMPRSAAELIRKLKESTTGAYLWQPGLQAGQPATLLGYPVYLAEDLPTVGAGTLSVAFGNFSEGYTIVDRMGIRILRDPFTAAPFVKFRCSKRVGGDVTNFEAIKLLQFS